jgi:hypothetical protein
MDWLVVDLPDLKNDGVRQLGLLFPINGKNTNVPNHQPAIVRVTSSQLMVFDKKTLF